MHGYPLAVLATVLALIGVAPSSAALTANLINNGSFEATTNLKNTPSLDHLNVEIPIHRFNQDADLSLWISRWGPENLCSGGYCGLAGVSTFDDARAANAINPEWVGTMNRSGDPFNAGNHIMENVAFRGRWAQWVAAPANQSSGPIEFSFDFYLNRWDPLGAADPPGSTGGAETVLQAYVYGMNELPPHDVAYSGDGAAALQPLTAGLSGTLIAQFNWGDWWDIPNTPSTSGNVNGWLHVTTADATYWLPGTQQEGGKQDVRNTSIAQTYPYYAITFHTRTYHESHENFWAEASSPTDTFALAVDNVSFQLSTAVLRGDVNLDGLVNALDISPFVTRLTQGPYQAEADINQDSLVNALDISGFVTCLVNGACAAQAGGSTVPEPAVLATILLVAGFSLMRRR